MIHIQSRYTEGREGGGGFLATKVRVVRESSSQGANGVRENKRPLEFGQFGFKCVEMVLVSHAGGLVWLQGLEGCGGVKSGVCLRKHHLKCFTDDTIAATNT